jgi:hypothetical protein
MYFNVFAHIPIWVIFRLIQMSGRECSYLSTAACFCYRHSLGRGEGQVDARKGRKRYLLFLDNSQSSKGRQRLKQKGLIKPKRVKKQVVGLDHTALEPRE